MAAVSSHARARLRCVAVVAEPQLWRKNRMTYHLESRGLEVVREAGATNTPHTLHDASVVVMQMSNSREADIARWKNAADKGSARFFLLPHERGRDAWRALDEWIGRALSAAGDLRPDPNGDAALLVIAEQELNEEKARGMRLAADLAEANNATQALNRTVDKLRKEIATMREEVAAANTHRAGIQAQFEAEKARADRLAMAHASNEKRHAEHTAQLNQVHEAIVRGHEKTIADLRGKLDAAAPKASALDALPGWLLPEMSKESTAFAIKLHGLVNDGILEPHEAREKWRAKFGGEWR